MKISAGITSLPLAGLSFVGTSFRKIMEPCSCFVPDAPHPLRGCLGGTADGYVELWFYPSPRSVVPSCADERRALSAAPRTSLRNL